MEKVQLVTWWKFVLSLVILIPISADASALTLRPDDNGGGFFGADSTENGSDHSVGSDSKNQSSSVGMRSVLVEGGVGDVLSIHPPTGPTTIAVPAKPLVQDRFNPKNKFQDVDDTPLNAAKVRRAISNGIKYLKSAQSSKGSWPDVRGPGDASALCVLALLNAGEKPSDPKVKLGLEFIRDIKANTTYFVSLRIMAFVAADPQGKKYLADIKRDVKWLVQTRSLDGGWSYGQSNQRMQPGDGSNSQFALLALHEATRVGVRIQKTEWEQMAKYWKSVNRPNGGFGYYIRGQESRGSMTCAGISSWIIIQENLADPLNEVNGQFANCCNKNPAMAIVDKAFAWLAKRYSTRSNPGGNSGSVLYYLYGLERAGRLSGKRFIGPHDWYRDGAKRLLFWQKAGGSWATYNGHGEGEPHVGTALALLFLAKGKRPVAIGKYDHGSANWDIHPREFTF